MTLINDGTLTIEKEKCTKTMQSMKKLLIDTKDR